MFKIDFTKIGTPARITNDAGESVFVHNLPKKSINNDRMANELLTLHKKGGLYMNRLNDTQLLKQMIRLQTELIDYCRKVAETKPAWDCTYNTGVVYYVDEFIKRYQVLFEQHDIDYNYPHRQELQTILRNRMKGGTVIVNDKIMNDISQIKNYDLNKDDIRGNSAGFLALLPHYTNEQFLEQFKHHTNNMYYGLNEIDFGGLLLELISRIETEELVMEGQLS